MTGLQSHHTQFQPDPLSSKIDPASGAMDVEPDIVLRFVTCGSVDDGKSSLIGRLLYDTNQIPIDQLADVQRESQSNATRGGELDLSLLVDGLQAEREQGITIDVAYRYFATPRRKFIVADTPGHEEYTRNMATGASTSELALILVDAAKGMLTQTRRHSTIVQLLGINSIVLAVNKMDLVGYSEARFLEIQEEYRAFAKLLRLEEVVCIPMSATTGENVAVSSSAMTWHQGPTLLEHLETVTIRPRRTGADFRFPVQWINRLDTKFRGIAGNVLAGKIRPGEDVLALPSGRRSQIARIVTSDGDRDEATEGDAITLTLMHDMDLSRGDVLVSPSSVPDLADQVAAHIVWLSEVPLLPGRTYLIKLATQWATAKVSTLKHKLNIDNMDHIAGKDLHLNEIGYCNLSFNRPLIFDSYADNRGMGGFILVDRVSNATVAAGMIRFALHRASNIHWQAQEIDRAARTALLGQKPACLWFTGLSGSGKSTVASLLEKRLHAMGRHTYILDGDNVRHGLSRDLGFADSDRVENIRRVAEVARLMMDAGLFVIVSLISPFQAERRMARELFVEGEFLEVFVDTPLEVCEARDAKGLYKKARAGKIKNFTGISSAYERPEAPEIRLHGSDHTPDDLVDSVLKSLKIWHLL